MKKKRRMPRKERWRRREAAKGEVERVVELIQIYLRRHQPDRYSLVVWPEQVQRRGDHWYVVVLPDKENVPLSAYSSRLRRTEDELERLEGLKVMLLPVLPPDEDFEYDLPLLWAVREAAGE